MAERRRDRGTGDADPEDSAAAPPPGEDHRWLEPPDADLDVTLPPTTKVRRVRAVKVHRAPGPRRTL